MKKLVLLLTIICLATVLPGAGAASNQTGAATPKKLFVDSIQPQLVELPSEAIPYWRDEAKGSKPALLMFSSVPFLSPLTEGQRKNVAQLVAKGRAEDFVSRGSLLRVNPAFISNQAVSAALDSGLFSKISWVFPKTTAPDQLDLEAFRRQVVEAGFFTKAESHELTLENGVFSGSVRGIPFKAIHAEALQPPKEPVIMHLDLSYFKGFYKSEIKTPLYPLLLQTVKQLKKLNIEVAGITLSYSTAEGELPLETRFMVNRFAALLENPVLLNATMPPNWGLHSEALYTINFFLESRVDELYEQAIQAAPTDPAVLYGLALRRMRNKDLDSVVELIGRAVQQDPGYALEYLSLADQATAAQDLENTVMLLEKGSQAFPQNPFIMIQLASTYQMMHRTEDARKLLKKLKQLPWSAINSGAVKIIDEMLASNAEALRSKK